MRKVKKNNQKKLLFSVDLGMGVRGGFVEIALCK